MTHKAGGLKGEYKSLLFWEKRRDFFGKRPSRYNYNI
jgi:hypothetical protein